MKVARLHAAGDVRLHDEPEPIPSPGEELVRVTAVGLCGSDRHWFMSGGIGDATVSHPLVLGHEIAGVIDGGPRRGTRVAIDPADPCGACDLCGAGRGNLCTTLRFAGHGTTDGGLRGAMAWPSHLLHPLPDAIADDDAALLEPLGVALHAVDLADVRTGMRASVHGCGPLGLLLIQLLRAIGIDVVAHEPLEHRKQAALLLGAHDAGVAAAQPVDVAFEVAGTDEAVAAAIEAVRPGGTVVLVGIPDDDRTSFPAAAARRKELRLLLGRRMMGTDLTRAIDLVADGKVDLRSLISSRHPLDAVSEAFDAAVERRGHKVIVQP